MRGVFAEETPTTAVRVIAVYRIDLADFNLGDFRFTTLLNGANYQMRGEGHFSMLGGLIYNWQGTTGSSGKLTNLGPEPAAYALNYVDGGESAQLHVSFNGGAVTQVLMLPKRNPTPRAIPIKKEQLCRRPQSIDCPVSSRSFRQSRRGTEGLRSNDPGVRRRLAF